MKQDLLNGSPGFFSWPGGPFFTLLVLGYLFFAATGATHPGDHSASSRLSEDAVSHHLEGEQFTLLVEYNPFRHIRRAEVVLALFDADGAINLDADLDGFYFPNNDTASTKSLFIRIDGTDPRLKISRPLVEANTKYTLKFTASQNSILEKFTITDFAAIPSSEPNGSAYQNPVSNPERQSQTKPISLQSKLFVLNVVGIIVILILSICYLRMNKKKAQA